MKAGEYRTVEPDLHTGSNHSVKSGLDTRTNEKARGYASPQAPSSALQKQTRITKFTSTICMSVPFFIDIYFLILILSF